MTAAPEQAAQAAQAAEVGGVSALSGGNLHGSREERAREAAATGASTLAVACPFCTIMLDDGIKQNGSEMRVADVATLLAEALEKD